MSRLQKGIISAVDTETVNGYAIILANERRSWVADSFETSFAKSAHRNLYNLCLT